jgi:hypothetical protein
LAAFMCNEIFSVVGFNDYLFHFHRFFGFL